MHKHLTIRPLPPIPGWYVGSYGRLNPTIKRKEA